MTDSPGERRERAGRRARTGPRNRPMRGHSDPGIFSTGRGRGDWRHSMMQDQMGCMVSLCAAGPVLYFLGKWLTFW